MLAACDDSRAGGPPILIAPDSDALGSACVTAGVDDAATFFVDVLANVTSEPVVIHAVQLDKPVGVRLMASEIRKDVIPIGLEPYSGEAAASWAPIRVEPGEPVLVEVSLQAPGDRSGSASGVWVIGETKSGVRFRSHTCYSMFVMPDYCPRGWERSKQDARIAQTCGLTEYDAATPRKR